MDNELPYFLTPEIVRSMLKATILDPSDPLTDLVLAQGKILSEWVGVPVEVVATPLGTRAHGPTRIVGIDYSELRSIFDGFTGEMLETAIFFALAHEYGHILQAVHIAETDLAKLNPVHCEAHADIIGGVWMGIKLQNEEETRLPNYLRQSGLRLKGSSSTYPSPYQRACIIERGMADTVWLASLIEPNITDPCYVPIRGYIGKQDVLNLLQTAINVLNYTPADEYPLLKDISLVLDSEA